MCCQPMPSKPHKLNRVQGRMCVCPGKGYQDAVLLHSQEVGIKKKERKLSYLIVAKGSYLCYKFPPLRPMANENISHP